MRSRLHRTVKTLFQRLTVPIMDGPLKGKRWTVVAGIRFLRGDYGKEELPFFRRHVKPGNTVYDIGAHAGYFSLVLAHLVGSQGQVIAFEPQPANIALIKLHLHKNSIRNVHLLEVGVSQHNGETRFESRIGSGKGSISQTGNIKIRLVALDELHHSGQLSPPQFIKMDIEGAEKDALLGAAEILKKYRPTLFISTHGKELHIWVRDFLQQLNYRLEEPSDCDNKILALPQS